mgnify:CR=1 FL=1
MKRWTVFKAVFVKNLIELRRYLFNLVTGLVTMYILFLLLFFGARAIGGAAVKVGDTLEGLVVGYLVWLFAIIAYQELAWSISTEAEIGTLEQLYLTPAGFGWVNGSFLVARFVTNLAVITLMLLAVLLTTGYRLNLDLASLLPLTVITILAPCGFGFLMGGLALVFKRIQNSFQILQFVFVVFLMVPVSEYVWARYLPLSLGNHLLRKVMVEGYRLWELPAGDLATAVGVGLAYLLLGVAAFGYCVNVARDRGLMGHY